MLDLNVTLLFQLANFFIALFVLNILLIRPIRDIIRKRKGMMDDISQEADSFESQASAKLSAYEAELARSRQEAGAAREAGRADGLREQQELLGEAQKSARKILSDTRASLQAQAAETRDALRRQVEALSARLADRLLRG